MKIILFFTYGISLLNWKNTGLLNREIKFYEKLYEKYGVSTIFVTFGDSADLKILKNKDFITVVPLYTLIKYDKNKYIRILRSFMASSKLSTIVNDTKIIKTNQLLGSWLAVIVKIRYKKSLIVRTGYDLITFSKKNKKALYKIYFYKCLTKLALKYSDIYLVSSKTDMDYLSKFSPKYAHKLKIRPNWIEANDYREFSLRNNNTIISVGRLEKQKNYEYLISKLKKSKLEIDIYGEGSQKNNLIKLARENHIKLNIYDPIPNELLLKKLKNYKIFVSSSNFEGNPKAILEAMGAGCVVVAKNNANIKEIIQNNINGILFEDRNDLSKLINEIMNNEQKWNKLSKKSIKSVKENNLLENVISEEYSDFNKLNYS